VEAATVRAAASAEPPCSAYAADLLRGAAWAEELSGRWVRPKRFFYEQERALSSCMAWYPGIFRQMSAATAGVRLDFETDATELALEVRFDSEPRATANVIAAAKRPSEESADATFDAMSVEVDGEIVAELPLEAEVPAPGVPGAPTVSFSIDAADGVAEGDLLQLPGFGQMRRVRLWLPSLRGCELGRVLGNGTFVRLAEGPYPPAADDAGKPKKRKKKAKQSAQASLPVPAAQDTWPRRILVLGDSISQGFLAGSPINAWPSVVSRRLGAELVNQGLGAQVFQPSSLAGLSELEAPDLVFIAYGENYRYGRCSASQVGREISEYLRLVGELFQKASIVVLLPAEDGREAAPGSCYGQVRSLIEEGVSRAQASRGRRGAPAMTTLGMPELTGVLAADAMGHPTAEGSRAIADSVLEHVAKLAGCSCLRDTGRYGRCGACVASKAPEPEPELEPAEQDWPLTLF
jgi:hypothetical protein